MASFGDTINRLQSGSLAAAVATIGPDRLLRRLDDFGTNPGALDGWYCVPATQPAALVVVLHGCAQTACGYDRGSGWSALAQAHGFAVLFPEQRRSNNANLCFNWFEPDDTRRDGGEALSIRQMIGAVTARHAIDPARVFVNGLSAGGAMANVMLATYPELFAGGAIIAGLPFGAAASISPALERMRGRGHVDGATYAALIRRASSHRGPWPGVTVWHGDADRTVSVVNAEATLAQWRALHGIADVAARTDLVDGHPHRIWTDDAGAEVVEDYRIAGMGHGTPLKTLGDTGCGTVGAHMIEAGISSTWRQAQRWGLLQASTQPAREAPPSTSARPAAAGLPTLSETIERTLRVAGLM